MSRRRKTSESCEACGVPAVRKGSSLVHADGSVCVKPCSGCAEQVTYDPATDLFVHRDGSRSVGAS